MGERIYCHSQIFSVARHVRCLKLGSKPAQLNVWLSIRPLSKQLKIFEHMQHTHTHTHTHTHMLYDYCWHEFGVCSYWPCLLWRAITLWLVNRGMAVRRGRLVEQVCKWKETMWYEKHVIRFRQSVQSESRFEPGNTQPISGVRSSLTIRLARGCKP